VGYPPCLHKGSSCQKFMVRSLESLGMMIRHLSMAPACTGQCSITYRRSS